MPHRHVILLVILALFSGCRTEPGPHGQRYVIGIQTAEAADPVYLRHDAKSVADGNTYTIWWMAMTNANSDVPYPPYDAVLSNNRWPVQRNHIDLSIDGGGTWTRRIGYGVEIDRGRVSGQMVWSPPPDYSLLTTNARLRIVTLDGDQFGSGTNYPFDVTPGQAIMSDVFTLAGIDVVAPGRSAAWYTTFPAEVRWRAAGAGSVCDVWWVTPYASGFIARVTNAPDAPTNVCVIEAVSMPAAPEVQIAVRSVSDPAIVGYSATFSVESGE